MAKSRWYEHEIRVRYSETDQMGVVYHTNYANWFEWGRTELIREAGMPYSRIEQAGLLLPVISLQLDFKQPAKYDDLVTIRTRITEAGSIRIRFEYELARTGEVLAGGSTQHVWVNREWKAVRLDRFAPELHALVMSLCSES